MKKSTPCYSLLFLLLFVLPTSKCSVYLYDSRAQYESLPASFGMRFEIGREYSARLQVLENDVDLCHDVTPTISSSSSGNDLMEDGEDEMIVIPEDGLPVALLAQRGNCSYEQKARVAMKINPVVQYVLIYDDQPDEKLKTMTAKDPSEISVGMQFISNFSGKEILLQMQRASTSDQKAGGIRILLDCYTPWLYPNGWIGWIMMFVSCLGSFLLCISTGFIRRDGTIIIVGPPSSSEREPLLTNEDVMSLPEIEYQDKSSKPTEEEGLLTNGDYVYFENPFCTICLEEYVTGAKLRVLPCHHSFHSSCISPWLTERQSTCPLCKAHVLTGGEEEEEEEEEVEEVRRQVRRRRDGDVETDVTFNSEEEEEEEEEEERGMSRIQSGWYFIRHPFGNRRRSDSTEEGSSREEETNNLSVPLLTDQDHV